MAKKYSKIYQQFPFLGPPKFTQYGSLGLKMYRLANPVLRGRKLSKNGCHTGLPDGLFSNQKSKFG
jgi:hypothetical protein